MKLSPRILFKRCSVLLAVCGTAALLWLVWPRQRLLLSVANKVCSTQGWMIDRGADAAMAWDWASDRAIVHLIDSGHGQEFRLLDMKRGETPLPALTRLYNQTGGDPDGVQISPDGRFVMWDSFRPNNAIVIASLDGSVHYSWLLNGLSCFTRWLGDSRHWVLLRLSAKAGPSRYEDAIIYRLDSGAPIRRLRLGADHPLNRGTFYGGSQLLRGIVPAADRILVNTWTDSGFVEPDFDIAELSLSHGLQQTRSKRVSAPPNSLIRDLVISPRGDRLAWQLRYPQTETFIDRWIPFLRRPAERWVGLAVSNIDGSNMHEIGRIPLRLSGRDKSIPEPDYLRWSPDGKLLSFVYRDTLFAVPAD